MWYEILPAFSIIVGSMYLGFTGAKLSHKWWHDKPFNKDLMCNTGVQAWLRDEKLTGDPYKPQGLETISDEPPPSTEC